jgi:S-adenosyl-L-methionine hydrolase (adenosine-forming)
MLLATLTTDYGLEDYYVASLKGSIYSACREVTLVDINHNIPKFDLLKAAFNLRLASMNYPEKTLHVCTINMKLGNNRFLLIERKNQLFLCPDNGLICLIFPDQKFNAYSIDVLQSDFTYRETNLLIGKVCEALNKGITPDKMGTLTTSYVVQTHLHPVSRENSVRGSVIYIDSFSNVIVNITREMFDEFVGHDKPYTIEFGRYRFNKISKNYSDVTAGEIACMFNEAGYLEIAMNEGKASTLLRMNIGDAVLVSVD